MSISFTNKECQRKEQLRKSLNEIIKNNQIKSSDRRVIIWLNDYLNGKKTVDKAFLIFLGDYLSLENTAIIKPSEISRLYNIYSAFREKNIDISIVYLLFSHSAMFDNSDHKNWSVLNDILQMVLDDFSGDRSNFVDSLTETISKYLMIFVAYPHVFQNLKELGFLQSKYFLKYVHIVSHKDLVSGFDIFNSLVLLGIRHISLRKALLREILKRINNSVIGKTQSSITENVQIITERIKVSDEYLCRYNNITNNELRKIIKFILKQKNESNASIIKTLLELSRDPLPGINDAITLLYETPVIFNIPEEDLIEMIVGLQDKWEIFSIDNSLRSNYRRVDYFQLFWIMQMYVKHKYYSIRTFQEALSGVWNDFFRSDELKLLFSELFFKYEKPYILIKNMRPKVFPVLEFLIQHHRINHYKKPSILLLTKKERQLFYKWDSFYDAPEIDNITLNDAIIFVKLVKHGIDEEIVKQITFLSYSNHLHFWIRMAPFFVRYQKNIRKDDARDIVDYMVNHPELEIKGRTIKSMRNLVNQWHERFSGSNYSKEFKAKQWDVVPIDDYYYSSIYRIVQYNHAEELINESAILSHCVVTYVDRCFEGKCAVFALQEKVGGLEYEPLITIEVVKRKIVQTKGKDNRKPNEFEIDIISEWAANNELKFDSEIR